MDGVVTGLAVGGLGGFNAHDAGVLEAAHDCGLEPDIITCTSGGMYWVHQYLTDPDAMEQKVSEQAAQTPGQSPLVTFVTGVPGINKAAYTEYWMRWTQPWKFFSRRELLNRAVPAQIFDFAIPGEHLTRMANDFNRSEVPVAFNAYAIAKGQEIVFCNDAAFDFLGVSDGHTRGHHILEGEIPTLYRRIDPAAVKSALWIVQYGFENYYQGEIVIDGAYHRQIMLAELNECRLIYVVKPQGNAWPGAPPENQFEIQDFNTEMWFNNTFASEVACVRHQAAGRPVAIECITMDRPLGYMNYLLEQMRNYREGYEKGRRTFDRQLTLADDEVHTIDLRDGVVSASASDEVDVRRQPAGT